MNLQAVLAALSLHPLLLSQDFSTVLRFIRITCLSKAAIISVQKNSRRPPDSLPAHIVAILAGACNLNSTMVIQLWSALKEVIWSHLDISASEDEVMAYNHASLHRGTSYRHLYPPYRACRTPECPKYNENDEVLSLTEPTAHKATLFTLREGALPIYTTSLYCRGCNSRYYHNYAVHKQSFSRTYYPGVPNVLQISKHYFIESSLLEFFANGKVFGWLSGTNCARIYNNSLRLRHPHIANNQPAFSTEVFNQHKPDSLDWQFSLDLRDEDVLNGFFLYSLLIDKAERRSILILPHDASSQKDRLRPALEERNKAMEGIGQEQWAHACDSCFVVFPDKDSGQLMKMQAAVSDGVTLGHPCCAIHDCKIPLANNHNRYCPTHSSLNLKCAVTTCSSEHATGFRTCDEHRSFEKAHFRRGKAFFQLRSLLKRSGVAVPADSVPLEPKDVGNGDVDEEAVVEGEVDGESCEGKPNAGNRKLHAYFGRRRTHNEQLVMRVCGIILSRATFFGSEAISAVNTFMKATFPTPESTPEYKFYDSMCLLDKHQKATNDHHFDNTGKPVDVFHFRTKHKTTDTHCQQNCNPAAFPELYRDGKWVFNTSICEQTNVWLGGFQAILRDMEVTRYNFFLDEVIKRRNRYTVSELERRGKNPWMIPMKLLFPDAEAA